MKGNSMFKNALILIEMVDCKPNLLFRYRLEDYLDANGISVTRAAPYADLDLTGIDLVLFCSCATNTACQDKSLHHIACARTELDRQGSKALLVVAGCLGDVDPLALARIHKGPVISHQNLGALDKLIRAHIPMADIPNRNSLKLEEKQIQVIHSPGEIQAYKRLKWLTSGFIPVNPKEMSRIRGRARDQYHAPALQGTRKSGDYNILRNFFGDQTWCVTIGQGCLGNCSYCAIPKSKGRLASRPMDRIMAEVNQGIENNVPWIALTGDDTGAWGRDQGEDFSALLRALAGFSTPFNLLIDNLNAGHLNDHIDALAAFAGSGRDLGIVLTLQHVNHRVLKAMRRHCDISFLKQNLTRLNRLAGRLMVECHFITGFPGETDEEFAELADFAAWALELNPNTGWLAFYFTPRPGTPAADMPGQVPQKIREERAIHLKALHDRRYPPDPDG